MCQNRRRGRVVSLVLVLLAGTLSLASGHSPARAWDDPDRAYIRGGSSGNDVGRNIVLDSAGNVYVSMYASTTTTAPIFSIADSDEIPCAIAQCANRQLILVKLNPAGRVAWIRAFQSNASSDIVSAEALAVDASANVYFAGYFKSDLVFNSTTISAVSAQDGFVVKLDPNGGTIWTKQIADSGDALVIEEIDTDASGNLVVAGSANGNVTVGALTVPQGAPTNTDGFLIRFDPNGNPQWGVRIGGTGTDIALDTSLASSGHVYVAGFVQNSASISATYTPSGGPQGSATDVGSSIGDSDFFVAKFSASGVVDTNGWPIRFGGTNSDQDIVLATSDDTVAVAAAPRGTVTISAVNFPAVSTTNRDVLVAAFSPSGTLRWGSRLVEPSDGDDYTRGVALASNGDVITTGRFGPSQNQKWFVARHSGATGALTWVKYLGTEAGVSDIGQSLALDADGFVYTTGRFDGGRVDPDNSLPVVTSRGSSDVLVVRLTPDGGLAPHPRAPTPAVASPTTPVWRVSLDPNGGTCRDGGSMRKEPWTSVFVGHRYLPNATDCTRSGYVFTGWTSTDETTAAVSLPRLVDPGDGERRQFLATNADLVALWTPALGTIDDLTVFANFLCGPCTNAWLLFTMPTDATRYTVSVNDSSTACTQSGTFFDLSLCEITGLTPGPVTFTITSRNDEGDGSAATIQVILRD